MAICASAATRSTLEVLRCGELTEAQARSLFRQGEEAVVFALLELTKQLTEAQGKHGLSATPSTPSAFAAGLDRTYISRLERNKKSPTLNTLFQLADALGVPASKLIARVEKSKQ